PAPPATRTRSGASWPAASTPCSTAVPAPAARSRPSWTWRAASCARAPLPPRPSARYWPVPEPWQLLSSELVFTSPWLRVRQDTVRLPNGIELDDYYVVEQFDFVKIFAV